MEAKHYPKNMIYLSIIFGLIGTLHPVTAQVSDLMIFYSFAMESYQTMDGIHDTVLKFETASTDDIMDKVADLSDTVDIWGHKIENRLDEMTAFLRRLPLLEDITNDVRTLTKYFVRIDKLYEEFKQYVADPASFNNQTVADLLEVFTSRRGDDVVAVVDILHALIIPEKFENYKKSVLLLLAQETQESALHICDAGVPQYSLVDFYSIVINIEMRALTMTNTGYLMKGVRTNTSYMGEIGRANEAFVARIKSYLRMLQRAMEISSKQFRRCDLPEGYKRERSFHEFEKFLQAVLVGERAFSSDNHCWYTCETLPQRDRIYPCTDSYACEVSKPVCRGSLEHCRSMGEAYFCDSPEDGARKLEWVKDDSGQMHPAGASSSCGKGIRRITFGLDGYVNKCHPCQCICTDDGSSTSSTHFISLREQVSDMANNKVIVGLQLAIINHIAHVEVLQGLLGANGTIDEDAVQWIEPEDIEYDRKKSIESRSLKFYKRNEDGSDEEMIEDKDIAVLSYHSRRIYLDKLTAPSKHVVTGIKFVRELDGDSTKPLHLEIQATPFDYISGELYTEKSVWIGPKDTSYVKAAEIRTGYVETDPRSPESSRSTAINTKPNTYVDIRPTGWDEDASQTTIPFVDAIPVYSDPLTPLSGVGLYHKKQKGYAGFLTLVLEGFDKSPYIIYELSDVKPIKEAPKEEEPKEGEPEEEKPKKEKSRRRERNRS